MNRKIGTYGGFTPGPLLIVFGGVHGNEPAGIQAIEDVFRILSHASAHDAGFLFKGTLIGLVGNLQAYQAGKRFILKDLNRAWTSTLLRRIEQAPPSSLEAEDREIAELLDVVHTEVQRCQPEHLILLDLHTTSATGGVFCIPSDDEASLNLAKALKTPVILGLLDGIEGTLLQFAAEGHFEIGGWPRQVVGVAFEAGQHLEPLSVQRSIAAIFHSLCAVGCISESEAAHLYGVNPVTPGEHLPQVTRLRHVQHVRPYSGFKMRPGYVNFQPVQQNEHLADDAEGPILSPCDGLILMPLYQPQGADGFFIVTEE